MIEDLYVYAVKINYILVDGKFNIYFDVRGKEYVIHQDESGIWLEDEDSVKCELKSFITDDKIMTVISEGECKGLEGWFLWKKEKG
jgi:hypothetical protein